ncbi:MAG: SDR family NAD(P)-dependent oxidoreductase [Deltaproteobacteria bacterium]|nr:SDR family NAD(P)-dependent oxidoreductase [Deltaproteobacteria bacterium]
MSTQTPRVALVTGASKGIGAEIVTRLRAQGFAVAAVARDVTALDALAERTGAQTFVADLTDASQIRSLLSAVQERMGSVDILVNNAGIAESAPLAQTDDAMVERTFAINVWPVFSLTRSLLPAMVSRGFGRVVNVASNAGLTGYAYTSAYCASKHAVVGFTRAIAAEIARTGVTINAICPGFVDTEMTARTVEKIVASTGRSHESARAALEAMSPQRRLMTVQEVAHLVLALVADEARGVHGQAIALDGGQVLA